MVCMIESPFLAGALDLNGISRQAGFSPGHPKNIQQIMGRKKLNAARILYLSQDSDTGGGILLNIQRHLWVLEDLTLAKFLFKRVFSRRKGHSRYVNASDKRQTDVAV